MQQPSVTVAHHTTFAWRPRLRAAGVHLALSALVAALTGLLVFALWYPYPYGDLSGGRELFQLVVSVDVVLGPLLTLAVFSLAKPRRELRRDLAVIVLLQLAGLSYGLWTVYQARPVHVVFEYYRFRVVHQADIPPELASRVPAGIEAGATGAPTWIALRPFRDEAEKMEFTLTALGGVPLSARPELWQPYAAGRGQILAAAKPVAALKQRFPQQAAAVDAALARSGRDSARAAYLPLLGRKAAWTVLLDAQTAEPIGYLPLDSF